MLFKLVHLGFLRIGFIFQPSIAVVLGFIGCKMILDYFGTSFWASVLFSL